MSQRKCRAVRAFFLSSIEASFTLFDLIAFYYFKFNLTIALLMFRVEEKRDELFIVYHFFFALPFSYANGLQMLFCFISGS